MTLRVNKCEPFYFDKEICHSWFKNMARSRKSQKAFGAFMAELGGTKMYHRHLGPVTMSVTCKVPGHMAPCYSGLKDQET